ncbi:MAG: hypothetical protein ACR2IV_18740 [Bryobacteraceae bacterium]
MDQPVVWPNTLYPGGATTQRMCVSDNKTVVVVRRKEDMAEASVPVPIKPPNIGSRPWVLEQGSTNRRV